MNFLHIVDKAERKINESFNDNMVFQKKFEKDDINMLFGQIKEYSRHSEMMYDDGRLYEVIEQIGVMIEDIHQLTLQEQDDWMDKISVNRDMKALKDSYKLMQKTAKEMKPLRERLSNCYDSMGVIIDRYYEIEGAD